MYREVSRLIMYGNLGQDEILMRLSDIFKEIEEDKECAHKEAHVRALYDQIYRILDLATKYGLDNNLWQCYIAYLLATDENPFSVICEKVGAKTDDAASVNQIVKQDMECFYKLFYFDFQAIETLLEVKCFSILTEYHSMAKAENTYNKSVSEKVKELAAELGKAKDAEDFFDIVTNFYRVYGVGKFGLNKAFRVTHTSTGE